MCIQCLSANMVHLDKVSFAVAIFLNLWPINRRSRKLLQKPSRAFNRFTKIPVNFYLVNFSLCKRNFFPIIYDGLRLNFAILPFQIKAFSKVKADSWRPQAGGQAGVPGHGLVFTWLSEPHLSHYKVHKDMGPRFMASSSPAFQNLIFHTTRLIKIWGPGSWPRLHLAFRTSSSTLQGT